MDIRKMLGDKYKENMTVEELMDALSALPMPKEPEEEMVPKRHFDKASSELAEMKRQAKAKMTADEQAAHEKKELEERLTASDKALARIKQERAFETSGYDSDTASKLAEALEKGDTDGFVKIQSDYMTATLKKKEEDMRAELLKSTPKIVQGDGAGEPADVAFAKQMAQASAASAKSNQTVLDRYK